jgi:hypothetical protein
MASKFFLRNVAYCSVPKAMTRVREFNSKPSLARHVFEDSTLRRPLGEHTAFENSPETPSS